jgi:gliding motility-associated-like protein
MSFMTNNVKLFLLTLSLLCMSLVSSAACPGGPMINGTRTPLFHRCVTLTGVIPSAYPISFTANNALTNYTVIWGDGKPNTTGALLSAGVGVNHIYDSLGVYNMMIISDVGGCIDTVFGTVRNLRPVSATIKPLPSGQNVGCAPHTIIFEDLTENAFPGTVLTWNFGDGTGNFTRTYDSANKPIAHTYMPGSVPTCTTQVSLRAENSYCTIGPVTVTVGPILILDRNDAQIGPPTPGSCSPSRTYTFPNNTIENCPSLHAFRLVYWDFGDGTHDAGFNTDYGSRTHTFPDTGTYTITLIDSNDCGVDITTRTIVINFPPQVGFTATPIRGCMPLTVNFNDTSTGNNNTRTWNFGDAYANGGNPNTSTLKAPSHRYDSSGTYTVRLRVSNPCTASSVPSYIEATKTIIVYGKPRVLISGLRNGCAPHTVTLRDSTRNISPSATYSWSFGNGQTSTLKNPAAATYSVAGTYTVKLVVTDTCGKDSIITTIRVDSVPTAHFTSNVVCKGDSTSFDASGSVSAPGDVLSYRWYFGTAPVDSSRSGVTPKYVYSGAGFTYRAILRATSDKGCSDYDTATITVKPSPQLNILTSPPNVCDTGIVTFTGDTAGSGTTLISYRWTFGAGTSDTAYSKDTSYRFPGPGTYTVLYQVYNSISCSTTVSRNITIHPIPDARPTSAAMCFGQFTQFRDSSTVGFGNTITQWQWDFNNDGAPDSTTKNPRFPFATAGTFRVKLRVGTNNNCFNTDSVDVTVNPLPVVSIANNGTSKCKQDMFTFSNTTTGAVSYRWRFGDSSPDSVTASLAGLNKIYADTGAFTVKMIATTTEGCRDSSSFVINSRPFPLASFTVNDTIACAPHTFSFANTSQLADTYRWFVNGSFTTGSTTRPDTTILGSGQQVTVSLIATNIYGCRPDTAQRVIRTITNPVPDFTMSNDSGCGPLHITFTNTTTGATSYMWLMGNGTGSSMTDTAATYLPSALNDSIYTVKLIAFNGPGCKDSISKTVTVFPQPLAAYTQSHADGCGPLAVTFTNTSDHHYGGAITDLVFDWDFGNGAINSDKDPQQTFTASSYQDTTYTVNLIATSVFGCKDTATSSVRIYPNPLSDFSVTRPSGCGPHSTSFVNLSIPRDTGNISIMTFEWNFANGNTANTQNTSNVFVSSLTRDTVYNVQLIALSEHGCRDTSYRPVLVYPKPLADFTTNDSVGCTPLAVSFTNASVPYDTGSIADMSFVWELANGFTTVSQNAITQYTSASFADSSYHVRLHAISEHGCRDTAYKTILVHPNPVAAFTNNVSQGCGPLEVQFNSASSVLATTYSWDFADGDTSTAASPSHTFRSYPLFDSIYRVTLSVGSAFGCRSDTVSGNIIARYSPVADFFPGVDSVCGSGSVSFTNQSMGGVSNNWNFGNGTTSSGINPVAIFTGLPDRDTTYTVRLIVSTPYSCRDTAFRTVKVNPLPDAQFAAIIPGCTPLPVTFSNTSLRAVKQQWDFGDGTQDSAMAPSKIFSNNTLLANSVFTVTLTTYSQSGCMDTAKHAVVVYPQPVAGFSTNVTEGCGPLGILFNNQSASDFFGSAGMTFDWQFSNGQSSVAQHPNTVFISGATQDTVYQPVLIASSVYGCKDTATTSIRVYPKPVAAFTADHTQGCGPLTVNFTNDSYPNDTGTISIMSFVWDFGNGFSSVTQNSTTQFTNHTLLDSTYKVRLFAASEHGCRDTSIQNILIHPKPIASFTIDRTEGCGPFDVTFTNTSQISTGHQWNFGDGDTAGTRNVVHTYESYPLLDSIYTASLVTQSAFGCMSDTVRRNITARYLPLASFISSEDSTCNPGSISFFNTSVGGSANSWNFGNGQTSSGINPITVFSGPLATDTTYTIRLVVTSPGSCRDTAYGSIKVNPLPDASFAAVIPGCNPLPVLFNNTTQRAVKYEWDFGDGTSDSVTAPLKTFTSTVQLMNSSFPVTLKAYSQSGCLDTAKRNVLVYPRPVANFTSNLPEGCGPLAITFNNQSASDFSGSAGITFDWSFGNGSVSAARNPSVTYMPSATQDSVYRPELIVTSAHGCKDTTTHTVTVFPKPKALFTADKTSGCGPLGVSFTNHSYPNDTGNISIMTFVWDFANGFNSISRDAVSEFNNMRLTDSVYRVKLYASSEHGCRDTMVQNITVNPKPVAAFTVDRSEGCGPFDVTFTNTSQISTVAMLHFGDGDSTSAFSPSAVHTYQSYPLIDSMYVASLVTYSAAGCKSDPVQRNIVGRYLPQAAFGSSDDSTCNPGSVSFFNTSVGGSGNQWNFGNGGFSQNVNPVAAFTGPATRDTSYRVRLVVTSPAQCRDTAYKMIKVNPAPDASFATVAPGCTPLPTTFNNTSVRAVRYEWDFGDGTTSAAQNPVRNFTNDVSLVNRQYPVTLKVYSAGGCSDTSKQTIVVFPKPVVNYTAAKTLRCDTAEFNTINSSQGATSFMWMNGSQVMSTAPQPVLYFTSAQNSDITHMLKLISTTPNGCTDSLEKPVLVHPMVRAAFSSTGTSSCANLDVLFSNQSENAVSYFWLFGDGTGSPLATPQHRYTNTGSYSVKLIAYDAYGCSDTLEKGNSITVHDVPSANYMYSPPEAALPNSNIQFTNLSTIPAATPLTYQWTFGDPATLPNFSSLRDPSHTFSDSGTYEVMLVVNSIHNCYDTIVKDVRINPHPPVPDFTYDPDSGCAPLTVSFTNTSQFADEFYWDFGDATTSTDRDPVHTYTFPSKYNVYLRAKGPGGTRDISKSQIIEVFGLPRANFFASPLNLVLPNSTVSLTDISTDAVKWKWKISLNGSEYFTDTAQNSTYTFPSEGKFDLELTVQNQHGCESTLKRPEFINVIRGGKHYIGNAFTPNGDGINDRFRPYLEGVISEGFLFQIYNRWGQLMFQTNDVNGSWDGMFNGQPATIDTYIWKIEGFYTGYIRFSEDGNVTLIR